MCFSMHAVCHTSACFCQGAPCVPMSVSDVSEASLCERYLLEACSHQQLSSEVEKSFARDLMDITAFERGRYSSALTH